MASLSQYPASGDNPSNVVSNVCMHLDLSLLALFIDIEAVFLDTQKKHLLLVPMALPTLPQSTSLAVTSRLKNEMLATANEQFSSKGIIQQSFFLAARDGYAQYGADNTAPKDFPQDMDSLLRSTSANPTLRHQMCNTFNSDVPKLSNLKSRQAVVEDLEELSRLLSVALADEGLEDISCAEGCTVLEKFANTMAKLGKLREHGQDTVDMFECLSKNNKEHRRFACTNLGRALLLHLDNDENKKRQQQMHYLALGALIKSVCPVFISPIGSGHEILAEILLSGGLRCTNELMGVPNMQLPRSIQDDVVKTCGDDSNNTVHRPKLAVNLYEPAGGDNLNSSIKHLAQQSISMSRSGGTRSAALAPAHG